jgi:hypothetical protein
MPSEQEAIMKPRVGDWMEVRTKEEILRTLDKRGRMEGLPFMPQMFQYCGQRFQVFKRAHKTCDWVYTVKSRRLPNGVHLDLRCDGEAYGGCQAGCLLYWKEAWLKPVNGPATEPLNHSTRSTSQLVNSSTGNSSIKPSSCTEADVLAGTRAEDGKATDEPTYTCQGTDVPKFTTPMSPWDIRQYVEDYTSGNVTLGSLLRGFAYAGYQMLALRPRLGRPLRWVYDGVQGLWGGVPYPTKVGKIPSGQSTPTCSLNLQAGELVRVKPYEGILATLDPNGHNRGLAFDAEMVPYCGGTYRVRTRMTKFIDEKTGKLVTMRSPCILLEGVWCQSRYSRCRICCPRSILSWWHEIWLERVPE